jgi:CheY-like chemotaxis protein
MAILIVEDEPELRESLREFLEDEGFAVATAANGAEALAALDRSALPCMMILDLVMPVLGGNALYERMQANPRLSQIPVLVSTCDPTKAPTGVPTMKKPLNLNRLLGAVRRHCPNC